jgi:hypothetical protein
LGVEGESKKLINNYKVGVCFDPENKESFLNAIIEIEKINMRVFKLNCDEMLKDFNRDDIGEKMINFLLKTFVKKYK